MSGKEKCQTEMIIKSCSWVKMLSLPKARVYHQPAEGWFSIRLNKVLAQFFRTALRFRIFPPTNFQTQTQLCHHCDKGHLSLNITPNQREWTFQIGHIGVRQHFWNTMRCLFPRESHVFITFIRTRLVFKVRLIMTELKSPPIEDEENSRCLQYEIQINLGSVFWWHVKMVQHCLQHLSVKLVLFPEDF